MLREREREREREMILMQSEREIQEVGRARRVEFTTTRGGGGGGERMPSLQSTYNTRGMAISLLMIYVQEKIIYVVD